MNFVILAFVFIQLASSFFILSIQGHCIILFGLGHVQFFFEKRRWWVWKKFSNNVHFKNLFHTLGQKRGRNCLHQKNSGFTIKGDNLSVSTYSEESVDVCIHCYKFPKTKKTIIMFSTKRENHLYSLLSLLCIHRVRTGPNLTLKNQQNRLIHMIIYPKVNTKWVVLK